MSEITRVASAPPKPLLIFDGDCNFCRRWISRWQQITGERVDYLPFQDPRVAERFPELPREKFEKAVQFIETEGWVYSGAEAVFRALAYSRWRRWPLWIYRNVSGAAFLTERAYRYVAEHRTYFSALTKFFWGEHLEPPSHIAVRWLFLRLLGLVYLTAFLSLWTQIGALIGQNGILPADQFMQAMRQQADRQQIGLARYLVEPTLCWFDASDSFLNAQCVAGVVLALLVIVGVAPAPSLFLLWLIYLSLTTVSRIFLGYQWDNLLLETGFLAIFLAPMRLWPNPKSEMQPSRAILWLLRWLLFRLIFASGCVKLLSDDPTWRNLTALNYHYETQPLPTWIGWYAHQLPEWFQKFSVVIMFVIELAVPFLICCPRRLRFVCCAALITLQLIIALTGNYCFFNLISIALCLLLLDDAVVRSLVPRRWQGSFSRRFGIHRAEERRVPDPPHGPFEILRRLVVGIITLIILTVTGVQILGMFGARGPWPTPVSKLYGWQAPFRSINNYGLFAVMTTSRPEIIVEGSNDGQTWLAYEFKYKPGDLKRPPRFVAPHQPRLDWQMWFAALGSYRDNPWFMNFCVRLLQGSPEVLAELERNPFPQGPPRYIRAVMYEYHFTDLATRRAEGKWWQREFKGLYCPALSLRGEQ